MSKPNKKAAWVEDLSFVLEECARVHKLISNTPPGKFKDLPRSDIGGDLPHPSGRGQMRSAAAVRRVRQCRSVRSARAAGLSIGGLEVVTKDGTTIRILAKIPERTDAAGNTDTPERQAGA
jgi:hypothetical protein